MLGAQPTFHLLGGSDHQLVLQDFREVLFHLGPQGRQDHLEALVPWEEEETCQSHAVLLGLALQDFLETLDHQFPNSSTHLGNHSCPWDWHHRGNQPHLVAQSAGTNEAHGPCMDSLELCYL